MTARTKVWVCLSSIAGTAGSSPAGGIDICLLWVLCVARKRSLRRANHSSRGVLPNQSLYRPGMAQRVPGS
jgi:hypothetical protein